MFRNLLLALMVVSASCVGAAEYTVDLGDGVTAVFLDGEEGRAAILDEEGAEGWFDALGEVEIRVRMGRAPVGETREERMADFKKYISAQVVDWTEEERANMVEHMKRAKAASDEVFPDFIPPRWCFVKTSGKDEGTAWYTRGEHTFFPKYWLDQLNNEFMENMFRHVLLHENAHVWSRMNADRREDLYGLYGFEYVGKIDLGEWLPDRILSNPDAPDLSWITNFGSEEEPRYGFLAMANVSDQFPEEYQRLLAVSQPTLFEVVQDEEGNWRVREEDGKAVIVTREEAEEFFEVLTANTEYVLHPEEILAEHLSMMIQYYSGMGPKFGPGSVKVPEHVEKLAEALELEVAAQPAY